MCDAHDGTVRIYSVTTVIVTRQEAERKPVRIPHAPSYPYVRAYRYCMRDTGNMRDAQRIRKMEMLLDHFGLGCMGAIVIYPTRATGVFPAPPPPGAACSPRPLIVEILCAKRLSGERLSVERLSARRLP